MVNVGASFGPILMGKLRAISWDYVFYTAAAAVALMFIITLLFYKEPKREIEGITLKQKFKDMGEVLSDYKYLTFIILLFVIIVMTLLKLLIVIKMMFLKIFILLK